ncbi:MAG: FkbM family methyltransferase [Myxococcota bacterium]
MNGKLRSIAERLSRNVVLRRRLPSSLGGTTVFVSPDARLRYWHPRLTAVEPELIRAVTLLVARGDTVWDIGANVGIFTFTAAFLAGQSGRVLAFEPDVSLRRLLDRSVALNVRRQHAAISVCSAAAGAEDGLGVFQIAARSRASNSLAGFGRSQSGGVRDTVYVPVLTLDSILKSQGAPNVVKIDVEGAECEVLRGANNLLRDARPLIYCEIGEEYRAEVHRIFQRSDYELFRVNDSGDGLAGVEQPAFDTFAIPAERTKDLRARHRR